MTRLEAWCRTCRTRGEVRRAGELITRRHGGAPKSPAGASSTILPSDRRRVAKISGSVEAVLHMSNRYDV
jgi:hypothetical protein